MIFPSSFKGVCQKVVILVVTLTSFIWPGDVFWLRPCELYNNSSLVRYKPHKKYVTNTIGVDISSWMARYHLKLNLDKSASLRLPAATAHPECCGQSRLQSSKVFLRYAPATITPLATSCCQDQILHPHCPVVEQPPHPHKNCSLTAALRLTSSLSTSNPQRESPKSIVPFRLSVIRPCIFFSA